VTYAGFRETANRMTSRRWDRLPSVLSTRATALPVLALVLLSISLRLYHVGFQSLWRDEVDVIRFSSADPIVLLSNLFKIGENGPLYYLFHHYWLATFGTSETALRLPSVIFGTAAVPVIYVLGRLLLDPLSAFLAALFAAISPFYIWYSQDAKMYGLLLLLSCLSACSYLLALQTRGRQWWALFILVTVVGMYIHLFIVLLVAAEAMLLPLLRKKSPVSPVLLLLLPAYLPLALWQIPVLMSPPTTGYPSRTLQEMAAMLTGAFVRGYGPADARLAISLSAFLLLSTVLIYARALPPNTSKAIHIPTCGDVTQMSPSSGVLVLLVCFFAPLVMFGLLSARMSIFTERYLIIASPFFYLLMAAGVTAVRFRHRRVFWLVWVLWVALSGWSLAFQSSQQLKPDFRSAVATFAGLARQNDLVIFDMPYGRHVFRYYYPHEFIAIDAPYTNGGSTLDDIDLLADFDPSLHGVVWLVSSEEQSWDARGLTRQWLSTRCIRDDTWDYPGVKLQRFHHRNGAG
jgi:mannosyltransferase